MTNEDGGKIIAKKCDIKNEWEVLQTFQWIKENFGHLDVFVNNAGVITSDLVIGLYLILFNKNLLPFVIFHFLLFGPFRWSN